MAKGLYDEDNARNTAQSYADCQQESHALTAVGILILTVFAAALAAALLPNSLAPHICVGAGVIGLVVLGIASS